MLRRLSVLSLALLAGCTATASGAPSLLPRAAESASNAEPVRATPLAAPDPALDREIAARLATFDAAATAFDQAVQAQRGAIERGARAAAGSQPWLDAQAAIGEVTRAHADADGALATLEELAIARAGGGSPAYPALDAAIAASAARMEPIATREAALRALIDG